jgi:hypothetical protein
VPFRDSQLCQACLQGHLSTVLGKRTKRLRPEATHMDIKCELTQ